MLFHPAKVLLKVFSILFKVHSATVYIDADTLCSILCNDLGHYSLGFDSQDKRHVTIIDGVLGMSRHAYNHYYLVLNKHFNEISIKFTFT